jgi:hypothetical protein
MNLRPLQVDVRSPQRLQLPAAQSGVEGGRPQTLIPCGQGFDKARRFTSRRDPVTATTGYRQLKVTGRVQWSEFAPHRVAEDRLEGVDRVPNGACSQFLGEHSIYESLKVAPRDGG